MAGLPRVNLAHLPTPLEEAPRLSKALGGPRILVKRDDQTGLATGGNKARKLEYLMADALAQGCTAAVTVGDLQSNHCRMTAAACRRLGLEPYLLLTGPRPPSLDGNLLLDAVLGAVIHYVTLTDQADEEHELAALADRVRAAGHRPYVIPMGGSGGVGAAGYVTAMREFLSQSAGGVDHVVVASASGGTQAGLVLGARGQPGAPRVHGISASRSREVLVDRVMRVAVAAAGLQGLEPPAPEEIAVHDEYVGPGYAVMTDACREAILLAARTEGLLLDPVYTGKAMAGLVDLIRRGYFRPGDTVVFWHTGGVPALQAYREWFA
ncbi:MAG: D-cysteine desulfhydrase family protein [bacterium]|nr:D-cysteine desulfhydrase family protein [bacterium]